MSNEIKPYPVDPSYLVQKPALSDVETSKYNIVRATQYGVFPRCVEIIESGFDVNQKDNEDVSLLHWAAINNRHELVKYFLSKGAEIDVIGGDLKSTPLHWAVRQQLLDMVAMLIECGANPAITDGEGNTCLHVATQMGHPDIVLYLLAKGMPVDLPNAIGETPLMIAASKLPGPDPLRLLIKWGANVNLFDNYGNTAGHHAAKINNYEAICQLDKAKINWQAINKSGFTVYQILYDRKVYFLTDQLDKMMFERGMKRHKQFLVQSTVYNSKFRFLVMLLIPPLSFLACGAILHFSFNYWLKLIALFVVFNFFRMGSFPFKDSRIQLITVFSLASSTTIFLCGSYLLWLTQHNNPPVNITFIISISFLWYFFCKAVTKDPGYILTKDITQRNQTILALASPNPSLRVPFQRFCTSCLMHKPLRSKHCSVCDKCVAKFDHHCPWIYNCVGVGNHAYFIGYLLALIPSLSLFAYGCWNYWSLLYRMEATHPLESHSNIALTWVFQAEKFLITAATTHPWLFFCCVNSLLYLVWVTVLFCIQIYQIFWLNSTTNERVNWVRYSAHNNAIPLPHKHGLPPQVNLQQNYPYRVGLRKHFYDFMQCGSHKVNWTAIHHMHEYYAIMSRSKYNDCEQV